MEFTRQRREKRSINEKYIVHSHVSIFTRIVNILVSVIMWAYMFIIIEVFVSACIDYNNDHLRLLKTTLKVTNDKLQQIIIGALIIFAIAFISLFVWKSYNKIRYGKLHRRKMPKPVSDKELLELNLIEPELYYELKAQKVIILERSPIRELYEA